MEFQVYKNALITLTWEVPWNSMELEVRQFRWHKPFHGIPWNLECANFANTSSFMEFHFMEFDDTSSSVEFHRTWSAPISLTRAILWNLGYVQFDHTSSSMEFNGTRSAPISITQAVPWNSMELRMRKIRWHEQFHGIPWNLECANFADRSSSMEFHGTWNAPISMTGAVPWNSVELGMRQFRWHEQFHGIPWNSTEF